MRAGGFVLRLTQKSKYAVRALVALALNEGNAPLCATSKVWDEARLALEDVFGRYSIAQLAAAEREGRAAREVASVGR